MPDFTINQLKSQSDSWKRLLSIMMEENAFLKERLSNMLKNGIDMPVLEHLEHFQSRFITEDELISLLRNDLSELDMLLTNAVLQEERLIKQTIRKSKYITGNMQAAQMAFSKLANEFNNYLMEHVHVLNR